ncbi:hypothetical protein [Candidatus Uabimicrobium sp. HlEnr_7]|uniref:hypothetical protein n=1 Tax=Candidatus Uabimicrobium helgolandensis TaxID=3095367 RepID=UPI003556616C
MNRFDHKRLDVYQVALQFVILAHKIVEYLPKDRNVYCYLQFRFETVQRKSSHSF